MLKHMNVLAHRSYVRRVMSKLPTTETPVDHQRRHLHKITQKSKSPSNVSISDVTLWGPGYPSIEAEWVTPDVCNKSRVLLYFHGGGFIVGSKESHRSMVAHIARSSGIQALSINYRLAPEHTYPSANQDCLNAYLWLLDSGYDADQIVFGGDSAGGFLVLQTLLAIRQLRLDQQKLEQQELEKKAVEQPLAAFLLSPLADALHFDGETYQSKRKRDPWLKADQIPNLVGLYLGTEQGRPGSLSPINSDLLGFPPILTHVGEDEILLSDSLRLHEQLKAHGVTSELIVWPKMWHVFHCMGGRLPQARQAIAQVGAFIKRQYEIATINVV